MARTPAKRVRAAKKAAPKDSELDLDLDALLDEFKQTDRETQRLFEQADQVKRKLRSAF